MHTLHIVWIVIEYSLTHLTSCLCSDNKAVTMSLDKLTSLSLCCGRSKLCLFKPGGSDPKSKELLVSMSVFLITHIALRLSLTLQSDFQAGVDQWVGLGTSRCEIYFHVFLCFISYSKLFIWVTVGVEICILIYLYINSERLVHIKSSWILLKPLWLSTYRVL